MVLMFIVYGLFRFFIFSLYFVSKYINKDLSGLLYAASVVVGFGAAGKFIVM